MWLAGCETTSNSSNPFQIFADASAPKADPAAPDGDTTGSVATAAGCAIRLAAGDARDSSASDPNDDLSIGKKYFRQGSYGLAERHFRKAVELHPRDAESWVGLAASYDRLRASISPTAPTRRPSGSSGRRRRSSTTRASPTCCAATTRRARATLLAAQAKDPNSPYIANNLRLLEESARKAKAVN